jgi:hypothetical protein
MALRLEFAAALPRCGSARSMDIRSGDFPLRLRLLMGMTVS